MIRITNSYDRAIMELMEKLTSMGKQVNKSLDVCIVALVEQDIAVAQEIIRSDDSIDDQDYQIEQDAIEIISLQQPLDDDLRALATVLRISKDLERIGDLTENMAEITIKLAKSGTYFKELVDIPQLGKMVSKMLDDAVSAYLDQDVAKAYQINKADEQVDELYYKLYNELIQYMKADPKYVEQATCFLNVARFLERIGDHAVNMAEMTIYQVDGERRPFKKS